VPHSCGGKPRLKLLIATDIRADVSSPRVPLRDIRTYGGLEKHFDVTWTFTATTANAGGQPIPSDARPVFVPSVRSKWHFFALFALYVRILADAMETTDLVLVPAPMLTTLPALVAAKLARRPSVLLVLAPKSALEFFRRRFNRRLASSVLNLEVALSTETLLLNGRLARGILSPLRKRLDVFMFSSIGKEDFLPVLKPSHDVRVELLCVARLVSHKRIDIAIETVWRLRRDGIDAALTIVGDGAERASLERLTEELDLSDVVDFVGWLDDPVQLRECYRRAFALLLPSEIEAFGMVVLEAMASGTPVVRTAPMGGLDVFERDVDVLIVPTGSAELFASAVNRLYTDRDLYMRIADAAQNKARSFTRQAWHESFCERAQRLVKRRVVP
jgi:glycosyltransferase involved in cell wall biosynthesis